MGAQDYGGYVYKFDGEKQESKSNEIVNRLLPIAGVSHLKPGDSRGNTSVEGLLLI